MAQQRKKKTAPKRAAVAQPAAPFIDRGAPLPRAYALNRIVALPRAPEEIFVYWDRCSELRVADVRLFLRVYCLSDGRRWDVHPDVATDNWYFRVTPDRTYRFDLYVRTDSGEKCVARGNEIATPVRWAGQNGKRPPAEVVHAARHPIARAEPRPLRKDEEGLKAVRPASPRRAFARHGTAETRTKPGIQRLPPGEAPEIIPVPRAGSFIGSSYTGGKE